ncbi:hypothetical protein ACFYPX_08320 [Micromonospora zamorensis]|uniref:hypothetical protein n=1 Tax=Micromonospora zamorensis TaxID=709883 RepID=UPI0036860325
MAKQYDGRASPEELRKLAADWRAQADRLESLGGTVMSAYNGIEWFGFAYLSATAAANAVNVKLRKMAEAAREFADFLDEYASKVEEQIKRERAAGIVQIVLAILGLLTIGLAFVLAPMLAALSGLLAGLLPAMSAVAGRIATMVIDLALGFLTFGSMQVAMEFGVRGIVYGAMDLPMEVGSSEVLLNILLAGGLGGLFSIRGVNSVPRLGSRGATPPPVPKMQAQPKASTTTMPDGTGVQLTTPAPVKGADIANTPRVKDTTPAVSASDITAVPVVPTGSHAAPVSASSAGDGRRLAVGAPGGTKSVSASTQQGTGHVNQPFGAPHPTTTTTAAPHGGARGDGRRMANLDRTVSPSGARGDFSPQVNTPASNVVHQPPQPTVTERGLVGTAKGRGIPPESPATGLTIHATPPTGPATVPHGTSLPPAMRRGGLPETSVLSSGNHLMPPTGRPGGADHVFATGASHTAPHAPGRVFNETATSAAHPTSQQLREHHVKFLDRLSDTSVGPVAPPRTADIAAPQHTVAPSAPRGPGRVLDETATSATHPTPQQLRDQHVKAFDTPRDTTAGPARHQDLAGPTPRPGEVDTAVAGHSDRSAATRVDSRLLDASAPPAPARADAGAARIEHGAVPLRPDPAATRADAPVPTAAPQASTPTPGRQLLQTGPDGRTDLVRVSAEPIFAGEGRRLGSDAHTGTGPGRQPTDPAPERPATGPDTSFSYTELRADGTMGPTTLRPGENVLHSQPLSGKPQERLLSYSADGRSWDVNPVAPAARPAEAAQPTQMLRQNPDGTVDLLTFQKPPALASGPPVKPRPGEASFHDLDGPGVRSGWQSRSIDPGERFTAEQVSKPQSTGQRLDGKELFFQREPTSLLVKDQASHHWTPLGGTEGAAARPKGWGQAPDVPPVTVSKPADNPSFSREGIGQGTPPDSAHYRWNEANGTVEPVNVRATSLEVAEIGTQTRSVTIDRYTATGGRGGGSGPDSLRMLPDGTLVPANPRVITPDQIRFDPKSGAITMDGASPTGGHSSGGGGGAPGAGGGGAPGSGGGGLSSHGPSRGSVTQTDDGTLTFVKPPSTAESSAAAMARDARTHTGAPGERPDPGRTLGSGKPATSPGAGIGGPAEAAAARIMTRGDDGQVVLGAPSEAPRNVLRKPRPEQTPGIEVRTADPAPGGHPAGTSPAAPATPAAPAHDVAPATPVDAVATPQAPPVVLDPTPPPAPTVPMRPPLTHEAPYVTAMPEGLSLTGQGNVVHLHTGTEPTRLVLRPGPDLTIVVDGSVTNLPAIRAALTKLHPSQPPISTVEFVGTRQPITPERAQQIADRLLTGLPGNPQISLLAPALTDAPAGAPAAKSYRFDAGNNTPTNPTPGHNLPAAPAHDAAPATPADAVATPQAPPVVLDPTPPPAPTVPMRPPLTHEAPYVTAMPEGLSLTGQGNVVHLHTGTEPTRLVLRPGPDLTIVVDGSVTNLPAIRAALTKLHPSQPPISTVEFVGTRQPITPERAQQIADRLLTGLPGNPQISLLAPALTDAPAGAPAAKSYRFDAGNNTPTNPTPGHNLRLHTDAAQLTEAAVAEQELHAAGLDVDSRFHAAVRQWRDAHPEQADRLDEVLPAVRATFDARTARSWRQLWETDSVGRGWATEVDRAARELPALLDAAVARPAPVEAQAGTTVDESVAELADYIFRSAVSTLEHNGVLDVPAGHLATMRAAFGTSMQATYDRLDGDDWDDHVAQQWTDLRANLVAAGLAVGAAQDAARAFHSFLGDRAGRPGALDATMSTHTVRLLGAQFAREHLAAHDRHFVGLEALQQQAFDDALAELRDPYTEISTLNQAARTQQWTARKYALRTDYAARIGTARLVEQLRPDLVGDFDDAVIDAAARTERSPQLASLDGLPAEVANRFRAEFIAAGSHLFDQVWAPVVAAGARGYDPAFQAAEHEWQVRYEQLLTAVRGTAFEKSADPAGAQQWETLAATVKASIPGYFTEEALRRHAYAKTPVEGDGTTPLLEATPTAYESAARPVVDQARAHIHAALHRPGRDTDDATRQRITRQLDARIRDATTAAQVRAERGGNTPAVVAAAVDGLQSTLTDLVRWVPVLLLHHALLGEQVRAAGSAFDGLPTIDLPAPVSEALGRSFTLDWLTAYDELFRGEAVATTGLDELAETVQLTTPAQHLTDGALRTALFDPAAALPGHPAALTERPTDPAVVLRTTPVDAHGSPTLQQWTVRWHVRPEGSVPPAPFGLRRSPDGTYALPDGWVIEDLPWYAWARPAQVSDEALATRIRAGEFAGDVRFIVGEPGVTVPTAVTTAGLDLLSRVPQVPGEPVPVHWFSDSELTGSVPDTRTAADEAADTLAANGHAEIRDAFLAETNPIRRNGLLAGLLGEGDAVLGALPALHTGLPVVKASDAAMAWLLGYVHGATRGEPLPVAEVRAAAVGLHPETKATLMDGLRLLAVANPERQQVLHALGALILDC